MAMRFHTGSVINGLANSWQARELYHQKQTFADKDRGPTAGRNHLKVIAALSGL